MACGTLPTDGAIILRLLYVHSIGFIGHAGKMLQTRTFSTSAQTEGNYTRFFFSDRVREDILQESVTCRDFSTRTTRYASWQCLYSDHPYA